jgi:hypothetical protein
MLADMGFTNAQAKKALRETVSLFYKTSPDPVPKIAIGWKYGTRR